MGSSILAVAPPPTSSTGTLALQILHDLLGGHEVLHTMQHGLALRQAQPQSLDRQFAPFHFQDAMPLFAVFPQVYDFHAELHARRHLMLSSRCCKR
jgi:hypothetical protein